MERTLKSLADLLASPCADAGNLVLRGAGSLSSAAADQLAFYADPRLARELASTRAGAVLVRAADASLVPTIALVVAHPHEAFARALAWLYPAPNLRPGVHPLAHVAASAIIPASAEVGPHCSIADGVQIGEGVRLHPGVRLAENVRIGNHCEVFPNVVVYHDCTLGARCIIHAGAVIGGDGFGFASTASGWKKVPQVGRVCIGDDVEIGANSTIDRGALEDTVIGDGVKIDNLVQIGHNCRIGAHTAIAGCVGIAGSAVIGTRCQIGGAAMIAGHLTIADHVVVSGGTLVGASIAEPGQYTGVFPTTPHRQWQKIAARVRRLANRTQRDDA